MIPDELLPKAQRLFDLAIKKGYNVISALGVCANVMAESGFNEGAHESSGGGGFGLGQWTPASNLYAQGRMLGYSQAQCNTFDVQCDILLRGDETGQWSVVAYTGYDPLVTSPQTLAQYKKESNLDQATMNYMAHWERPSYDPSTNHKETRKAYAKEFQQKLNHDGETGGEGYQLAVLPIHYIYVTQSEFTPDFSHAGTEAVDMVGETSRYPLYAPCDVVCVGVDRGEAFVTWQSQKEVRCVDGTISFITFHIGHDDTHTQYNVGDTFKKGELFGHTGNSGHSFGDHLHIEVSKSKFTHMWEGGGLPRPAKLWHVFSSCDNVSKTEFKIVEAGGIPWVCDLNWKDGDGGTTPSGKDGFMIRVLTGIYNGWRY